MCNEMAESWCNSKPNKCSIPGCADSSCSGDDGYGDERFCQPGLARNSSGDCICPGTNKVAGRVEECTTAGGSPSTGSPPGSSAPPPGDPAQKQKDIQACFQQEQQASDCCANPVACIGGSISGAIRLRPGEGIAETCRRMQEASLRDAQIRNQAANACTQRQSACKSSCQSALSKWGTDSSAKSLLEQRLQSCESFTTSRVLLGMAGTNSAENSALAERCNQVTRSDLQSTGGSPTNRDGTSPGAGGGFPSLGGSPGSPGSDPYNSPYQQAMQYCEFNPNDPRCRALQETPETPKGKVGFETGGVGGAPNFDLRGGDGPKTQFNMAESYDAKNHAQVNPVANNAGGGIPGQGSQGMGARMDQPHRGGAPPPSYTTDVLKGFQGGGGGSAPANAMNANAEGGWSSYGRGGPRRGPASMDKGIDLRQFLPGGSRDPRMVGGRVRHAGLGKGIHPRSVNLFHRISTKFREKCRLGILADCR